MSFLVRWRFQAGWSGSDEVDPRSFGCAAVGFNTMWRQWRGRRTVEMEASEALPQWRQRNLSAD